MPRPRPLACAAFLTVLAQHIPAASADCVITQTDLAGFPYPAPKGTKPQPMTIARSAAVCPEYYESSCCSPVQNYALGVNMEALASAFNDASTGGCPACFQNLKNFWCAFTCSPNQDSFLETRGMANATDPTIPDQLDVVVLLTMHMNTNYSCAVFGSCQSTEKVRELATMHTCEGFFAYQGQYGAIPHGVDMSFSFSGDTSRALSLPEYNCCNYPSNFSDPSQGNTSCPCATCIGMCGGITPCLNGVKPPSGNGSTAPPGSSIPNLGVPDLSALYGFNAWVVLPLYLVLFVVSVALLLYSYLCGGKRGGGGGGGSLTPEAEANLGWRDYADDGGKAHPTRAQLSAAAAAAAAAPSSSDGGYLPPSLPAGGAEAAAADPDGGPSAPMRAVQRWGAYRQ